MSLTFLRPTLISISYPPNAPTRWKRVDTSVPPSLRFGVQFDEVLVHREQMASLLESQKEASALLSTPATVDAVVRNDFAGVERMTGVRTDAKHLAAFTSKMLSKAKTATALSVAGAAEMHARLRTTAVDPPPVLVPPTFVRDYGRSAPLPLAAFGAHSGASSWMHVSPADLHDDSRDAAAAAAATAAGASAAVAATGATAP